MMKRLADAGLGRCLVVAAAFASLLAAPAFALEEPADEKDKLKACEAQLCGIVLKKEAAGGDLKCDISKTWARSAIKDGIEKKKISWSFGDARCGINFELSRNSILQALTKPEHALEFGKQTVRCQVEREREITPINVTLAPKINFKGGKADKAWLNVGEIEAPSIVKGAIWTAAKLEDNFGLFHGEMISEINEFLHEKCARRHGG